MYAAVVSVSGSRLKTRLDRVEDKIKEPPLSQSESKSNRFALDSLKIFSKSDSRSASLHISLIFFF